MSRRSLTVKPLSKRRIDDLEYPFPAGSKKVYRVGDGEVNRLSVRVYPSGLKTFVIRYYARGKQMNEQLGTYGPMTLDQARSLARLRLMTVEMAEQRQVEIDPALPSPVAPPPMPTFGEFVAQYDADHLQHKRTSHSYPVCRDGR